MPHDELNPATIKARLEQGLQCATEEPAKRDNQLCSAVHSQCSASLYFFRNGTQADWNQAQVDGLAAVVELLQGNDLDDDFRQELLSHVRTGITACDAA